MAVISNLYPPIVDTYAPAFLINSGSAEINKCKVYFSLSAFNNVSQIKNVQVTIRNQNTNLSALDPTKYPSEIMITDLLEDQNATTNEKYYIEIKPEDMIDGNFVIDQYYKVQLRFTGTEASNPPITENSQPIDAWLVDNLLYFSEWSTIILVRGISKPTLSLLNFTEGGTTDIPAGIVNIDLAGELTFEDENETETMKSYQVTFLDNDENPLFDSGIIYTSDFNNPNEIQYEINYEIQYGYTYCIDIEYITQNLFKYKARFFVFIEQPSAIEIDEEITVDTDEDNGRTIVHISRDSELPAYTGQIVIRRADSKTNFTIWEDMRFWAFDTVEGIDISWSDFTIESGVWYKYAIQEITEQGARSAMKKVVDPVMVLFDHAFLTVGDKQLKLAFNPQISTYKKTISESRIETIGSKYPYIRRNADINYVQFPFSGFIASAMDDTGFFTTKPEIYLDNETLYANFNEENDITEYDDFIYEKFFRDKVMDFLYENKIKLFRSPTEGNLLVRLMDIQFQPNQTLGRRLWSFSTNLFEMDECNLKNLEKYGLLIKGDEPIAAGSIFTPVKRIVIINDVSEFPAVGLENVLYVYKRQLYIYDQDQGLYLVISIPYWGQTPESIINPVTGSYANNNLYTYGNTLYQWDAYSRTMEPISELTHNQEYFDGAE